MFLNNFKIINRTKNSREWECFQDVHGIVYRVVLEEYICLLRDKRFKLFVFDKEGNHEKCRYWHLVFSGRTMVELKSKFDLLRSGRDPLLMEEWCKQAR